MEVQVIGTEIDILYEGQHIVTLDAKGALELLQALEREKDNLLAVKEAMDIEFEPRL